MDEDIFDEETLALAEALGVSPDEVAGVVEAVDYQDAMTALRDSQMDDFLEENGLEGIDLDSGEFY